jgi:chromosome segregation ATPase
MVPVTQKATASQSAPMDVLEALRSRKASLAVDVAQANGGVTIQGVKLLEAKLKAAELREKQYRSEFKTLESQLEQLKALPAQLAALKALVEQQQQTVAKGPSPEDVEIRLSALENAKPAVETAQFEDLQSDVQSLKLETKKLNKIPDQLVPLQATVTQQGQDIAKVLSRTAEPKTGVDSLATIKEEVRKVQEQQKQTQALRSDMVKRLARAELKSDVEKLEKLEGIQTQHQATIAELLTRVDGSQKVIKDVSTKVETNQRSVANMTTTLQASETTLKELRTLNLPARVSNMQEKIGQIEYNDGLTFKKAEKLGKDCERFDRMYDRFNDLDEDFKDLDREVKDYIGPIRDAFKDKNQSIIERMARLEKEQDKIANRAVSLKEFNELREAVTGFEEDKEKLAKGLQTIRASVAAPQPQRQMESSTSGASGSDLLAPSIEELDERYRHLKKNALKLNESRKASEVEQVKQGKTIDRIEKSQNALQIQQDVTVEQIKAFEDEQTRLASESKMILKRLQVYENNQAKLSEGHGMITTSFETLKANLLQEHNEIVDQVNIYHKEQVNLSSQQKTFQAQQDRLSDIQTKLKETSESLVSRITAFDMTVDQVKVLANTQTDLSTASRDLGLRITALEKARVSAADHSQCIECNHADTEDSSSRIEGLETRLRSVENHVGGNSELSTRLDQLETDMEEIDKAVEDCQDKVTKLGESFVGIFETTFDPFQKSVEETFKGYDSSLSEVHKTLAILQDKVEASQKECPAGTVSAPQLKLIQDMVQGATEIKQDLSRLQDSVLEESEQRKAAVEDLQQQVAIKQDAAAANKLIDGVRHSLRALTSQCENIVTDDLHQRMVSWFMQSYDKTNSHLLKHIPDINLELQQMRHFTDVFTRIPNSAQTLSTLAQLEPQLMSLAQVGPQLKSLAEIVPQLTALAQSPPATERSRELSSKTAESLKILEDQMTKAVQQHSSLAQVVKGLKGSLQSLNNTPFAKADSLTALEKSIMSLRAELKANTEEGVQARKEFEPKALKEHEQRLIAEKSIKDSLRDLSKQVDEEVNERKKAEQQMLSTSNEKLKELENAQATAFYQSEKVQKALEQLRSDLDKALSDINDPKNKEALACLPILFLHVGQLQWVLEDLNQNLPKGGLEIEWHNDFKDKWPIPSPFPDANGAPVTPKGKGKGKKRT